MHVMLKSLLGLAGLSAVSSALADPAPLPIAQTPLFLRQPESPLNLLVLGRDHKLFYEAYNDASDLNSDGTVDVGYKPASVTYFGIFDSNICYDYGSGYFTPSVRTTNKKCTGKWSGDFLNYVTTARIDALRKVLYGGKRSTDSLTQTIVERGYVPQDGHSWAKEYTSIAVDGYDIAEYTPLAVPSQANVRHLFGSVNLNGSVTTPMMRVLPNSRFRVWNWASIEGPVLADNRCFNDQNQLRDCRVNTAGEQFEVVPSTWFSGLTRVTYRRESTLAAENVAAADKVAMLAMANAVISATPPANARRCGSAGVANIDGTTHGFNGSSAINNGTQTPETPARTRCDVLGDNQWFLNDINGTLNVPAAATYIFKVSADDRAMLFIDGTYRAGVYGGNTAEQIVTITLSAGNHPIRFLHAQEAGGVSYKLEYSIGNYPLSQISNYTVRAEVCKTGLLEENCRGYPAGATTVARYKPTGLLHEYGEDDTMMFGLLTGSYRNNQEGGILRKAVVSFRNELDLTTGLFNNSTNGIVKTMNALKVNGFSGNTYNNTPGQCPGLSAPITRNQCYDWGNPLAEIMYEGMRYFAGQSAATASFIDSSGITSNGDTALALPEVSWSTMTNPYRARSQGGYSVCAKPFMTVISDINPSYDTDLLPGVSTIGTTSLNVVQLGQDIWTNEFGGPKNVFIGDNGTVNDNAPTAKTVTSFGNIRGLSPEEPTKNGGFYSASVAYWGLKNDVSPATSIQKVRTFSVALASPLPRIEFPVGTKVISLVPFGKTVSGTFGTDANFKPTNTIVDFYVEALGNFPGVEQFPLVNGGRPFARFRINYEDVEQGNDHDMDAIIRYNLELQADGKLRVRLTSEYAAGSANQNLGYIISGTKKDGVYLEVRDIDNNSQSSSAYRLNTPPGLDAGACAVSTPPAVCATGLGFTSDRLFEVQTNGTAAATTLRDPLWYAAKYGGFNDKSPSEGVPGNGLPDNGGTDEEWDLRGPNGLTPDGNPDNYFLVTNALTLSQQLRDAFQQVLLISRPLGKLSTNSTRINGRALLYQGEYDSRDWTGDLRAFRFDEATLDIGNELWKVSDPGKIPVAAARKIFTFNPAAGSTGAGVNFELSALSTAQKAALHASSDPIRTDLINYLRGDQSKERSVGGIYRDRSKRMGDIANSNPAIMSRESYGYERSRFASEASSYTAFLQSKAARGDFVFVGANDGMLHAFDGSSGVNGGREVFAFIPNGVFNNLKDLADPSYSHKFYADGAPTLSDVKIAGGWRSVLVAGLGAGGKSVYALDVTQPASFGAGNVLWEFTDPDLGVTVGQPKIAQLPDGRFAAIFGNGYNSTNNKAYLFIVDIASGTLIRKIDTSAGTAGDTNGLGAPVVLDASGVAKPQSGGVAVPYTPTTSGADQYVFDLRGDTVFAGDLLGNMWKFDISAQNPGSWSVVKLYQAMDSGNKPQRITAAPQAALHPVGGVLVFFGTGRYFVTTDNDNEPTDPTNTFYAVWDTGLHALTASSSPLTRAQFMPRTLTGEITVGSETFRTINAPPFEWGDKFGFYLDFVAPNGLDGERILAQPLVRFGRVFFNTFAPNVNLSEDCQPGGRGYLMVLSAFTGRPAELLANGAPCAGCAGIGRTTDSPPGEPTLLTGDGVLVDVRPRITDPDTGNTTGGSKVLGRPFGQLSWRELK